MLSHELLGILSVVAVMIGNLFYIVGIFQGKVKPHFISWILWFILFAVAFAAQFSEGGGAGTWAVGTSSVFCLLFAIVGLGASSRIYIKRADWFFLISALATIPLWYFTKNPLWSVILIVFVDIMGFIPTFRKTYFNPETENIWNYVFGLLGMVLSLFALSNLILTTYLYPAYVVLSNGALIIMYFWRTGALKKNLIS